MTTFLPEVFVSNAALASRVFKELKKGLLRKLGSRVLYHQFIRPARGINQAPCLVYRARTLPESIIVDRTALEHRPAADGSVFIVSKKKRAVHLPGLSIHPRKGHGPLEEDKPFMGKLYLSCPARAYLENLCKRRTRTQRNVSSGHFPVKKLKIGLETVLQGAGT